MREDSSRLRNVATLGDRRRVIMSQDTGFLGRREWRTDRRNIVLMFDDIMLMINYKLMNK